MERSAFAAVRIAAPLPQLRRDSLRRCRWLAKPELPEESGKLEGSESGPPSLWSGWRLSSHSYGETAFALGSGALMPFDLLTVD